MRETARVSVCKENTEKGEWKVPACVRMGAAEAETDTDEELEWADKGGARGATGDGKRYLSNKGVRGRQDKEK